MMRPQCNAVWYSLAGVRGRQSTLHKSLPAKVLRPDAPKVVGVGGWAVIVSHRPASDQRKLSRRALTNLARGCTPVSAVGRHGTRSATAFDSTDARNRRRWA